MDMCCQIPPPGGVHSCGAPLLLHARQKEKSGIWCHHTNEAGCRLHQNHPRAWRAGGGGETLGQIPSTLQQHRSPAAVLTGVWLQSLNDGTRTQTLLNSFLTLTFFQFDPILTSVWPGGPPPPYEMYPIMLPLAPHRWLTPTEPQHPSTSSTTHSHPLPQRLRPASTSWPPVHGRTAYRLCIWNKISINIVLCFIRALISTAEETIVSTFPILIHFNMNIKTTV